MIVASNAGEPRHPGWYFNLLATPDVVFGGIAMRATEVSDHAECERLRVVADNVFPAFAAYRREALAVNRTVPLIRLSPSTGP